MTTSNEKKQGWLKSFSLVFTLAVVSQILIACPGGNGGSSAPTPVPIPIGVGIGTFNAANCGGTSGTNNFIACAIGKYPGFEVMVQINSASGVGVGGLGGTGTYVGPVVVTGVINVLQGYGCSGQTSYSFTSNAGAMNYNYYGANDLVGTVNATGTSSLTVSFGNILNATGANVTSSTGQSFAYHLMGNIQVISAGGIGVGVGSGACYLPTGNYFLN